MFRPRHVALPPRPSTPASVLRSVVALGALLGGLVGASCDNPACVYSAQGCTGGAAGGGGALGSAAAGTPFDGARIRDGLPTVVSVSPGGSQVNAVSPVAIRFSESMIASSVLQAFRLQDATSFPPLPILTTPVLVGDDQLLLLFPNTSNPLPAEATIDVVFDNPNGARDLTGQPLDLASGAIVGSFVVAASAPPVPQLVASWPPDGAADANERTDIVAVFDRLMAPAGFAAGGFEVEVDGAAPVPDPTPQPLEVLSLGGLGLPDARAWVWRRLEPGSSTSAPLDPGASVTLSLSVGSALEGDAGGVLASTVVGFSTPAFATPDSISITSAPNDAIGIANLAAGERELQLAVELAAAAVGDRLDLFAFGLSTEADPIQVAAVASRELTDTSTTQALGLASIPLLSKVAPFAPIFADGEVSFAVRQTRGAIVGPLRVIDLDPVASGTQSPVLDTVPPTLVDLTLPGGGGDQFLSDLTDLSLTGRASELVRAVDVRVVDLPGAAGEINNSVGAVAEFVPVVGAAVSGDFVAAPVPVGVVPTIDNGVVEEVPPITYSFTLYDRALNPGVEQFGLYRQRGAISGDPATVPGELILVEVVDRSTLEPVAGATVVVAQVDPASTSVAVGAESFVTGADGRVSVPYKDFQTVVTVDAAGYDLFTYHGVETRWLGVTLAPSTGATASVAGDITGGTTLAQQALLNSDLRLADTRRTTGRETFAANACTLDFPSFVPTCDYGPDGADGPGPIRSGRVGAQSVFLGAFDAASPSLGASEVLKGFELTFPLPAAIEGALSVVDAQVTNLFSTTEEGVEIEDLPVTINERVTFDVVQAFDSGLDTTNLVDDPVYFGVPDIFVEARLPGLDRPAAVGVARAFEDPLVPLEWDVDAYYDVALESSIGAIGSFDELVHLSVTFEDVDGDRATVRPRLSQLPNLVGQPGVRPPVVPRLLAPDETVGGVSDPVGPYDFELVHNDVLIGDILGFYEASGLFHVRVEDTAGRGWDLYRIDVPNADPADPRSLFALSSADPALALPGVGLAPGPLTATVGLYAWRAAASAPDGVGFDRERLAWSDLEREAVLVARSRPYAIELASP
jgi:hypothetical protein